MISMPADTNLVKFIQEVYNLSRPQGMGFLHYKEGGLSEEEAKSLIHPENGRLVLSLDYVKGRACKMTVFRNDDGTLGIHDSWYDHSEQQLDELMNRMGIER